MIEIVPYNSNWPAMYETEATKIKQALGNNCIAMHHIGSTSVPGLIAKPRIDIIAEVHNAKKTIVVLEQLGIEYMGEYNIPMHYGFRKRDDIDFNLHVYEENHPEVELNITFRDYLRKNLNVRDEYAKLKQKILQDDSAIKKTNSWFSNYTLQKGQFIRRVLDTAGFNRLRIIKCSDDYEYSSVKLLGADSSLFSNNKHVYLALYYGVKIVGYAHVYFASNNNVQLKELKPDPNQFLQEAEEKFLAMINNWCNIS